MLLKNINTGDDAVKAALTNFLTIKKKNRGKREKTKKISN